MLVQPRLEWRTATVRENREETAQARTLVLDVPDWPGHRAGQHVDIRLTADDGYQAERSYSIASAPESAALELTIERIDDGEVSPYLTEELVPGDAFELRGPIGGYFAWQASQGGPLLLVGGGSGLVPLMAMLRHRGLAGSDADTRLLVSTRILDDLLYRDELLALDDVALTVTITLTRGEAPAGWTGFTRGSTRRCSWRWGPSRPPCRVSTSAAPRRSSRRPPGFWWSWDTSPTPSTPSASDPREADHAHRRKPAGGRTPGGVPRRVTTVPRTCQSRAASAIRSAPTSSTAAPAGCCAARPAATSPPASPRCRTATR